MTQSVTGDYAISLNVSGTVYTLTSQGKGDVAKITFPDEYTKYALGKNGNVMITQNFSALKAELEVKVIVNSSDDRYLQSLVTNSLVDFVGTANFDATGTIYANNDNSGTEQIDINITGARVVNFVSFLDNSEGNEEMAMVMYKIIGVFSSRKFI